MDCLPGQLCGARHKKKARPGKKEKGRHARGAKERKCQETK